MLDVTCRVIKRLPKDPCSSVLEMTSPQRKKSNLSFPEDPFLAESEKNSRRLVISSPLRSGGSGWTLRTLRRDQAMALQGSTSTPKKSRPVTSTVSTLNSRIVSNSVVSLALPKDISMLGSAKLQAIVGKISSDGTIPISIESDVSALYVVLTTQAQGRFSDNLFFLPGGKRKYLRFIPFVDGSSQENVLRRTLRVEDLSANIV